MKKKYIITMIINIIAITVVLSIVLHEPYKPISFIANGDNFSATVENGGTLLLNLKTDKKHIEWTIAQTPENFVSDYNNVYDDGTEFHIIARNQGNGTMRFQCLLFDGTVETYELTLFISRHQKIYLQIDSFSFEKLS